MIKKYTDFINESVKDLMKGKTDDEILKSLDDLTPEDILIKSYNLGYLNGVKLALKKNIDPSISNNNAIKVTSTKGYTEIVKLLLQDPRVDPSDSNNTAIRYASEKGHTEIVKLLLQDPRVDPSAGNNYAIQMASSNGHTETIEVLLNDPRVDPSSGNNYAIQMASKNGHTDVVKLLLQDDRVDPSSYNNYAIKKSYINKHTDIVKLLLSDKRVLYKLTDKKIKYYENQIKNLNESVKDLMKPKSEDEILNNVNNLSPQELLLKSCHSGYLDGVKLSLKKGADPSLNKEEIIKYILNCDNLDVFKLMITKYIDPSFNNNILVIATTTYDNVDALKLLLKDKRVDPSDKNNLALTLASNYKYTEIVKLLLQDKRVRDKMTDDEIKKYENQINGLNESVRDLMKGKSKNEIFKEIDKLTPNEMLVRSTQYDYLNGVKLFIKNDFDPSINQNYAIRRSSYYGSIDIVKLLLQDKRVDPTVNDNESIKNAYNNEHIEIVKLLLQDKRVRDKLSNEEIKKYENQIKNI